MTEPETNQNPDSLSPTSLPTLAIFAAIILFVAIVLTVIITKKMVTPEPFKGWAIGEPWCRFGYSTDADTMTMLVWTGAESIPTQTITFHHPGMGAGAPPDSVKYRTQGHAFTLVIVRPDAGRDTTAMPPLL